MAPAPAGGRWPGGRRSAPSTPGGCGRTRRPCPARSGPCRCENAAVMTRSGLSPAKSCSSPASSSPTSASAGSAHVVEEELELLLRARPVPSSICRNSKPGVLALDDEQARLELAGAGVLGAADDQGGVGDVDAGDEDLAAGQQPAAGRRVAARGGGDAVRVGAGVRLGDAERHPQRAVGEARQPALLLRLGAEAGDAPCRRSRGRRPAAAAGSPRRPAPPARWTVRPGRRPRRRTPRGG